MVGQEKNLPKRAIFGTFYRDLCRILFASVLCFFVGLTCLWAADIHYYIFAGADTVSCDTLSCPGLSSTCYSEYPNHSGQCSGTYTPGNTIILGTPTNSNPDHPFLRWEVSGAGCLLVPDLQHEGQYRLSNCSGNVSLDAVWQYDLTYNLNKPVGVPSLSAITNQPSQNPQHVESNEQGLHLAGAPSTTGYDFLGWNCYDPNYQGLLSYVVGVRGDGVGDSLPNVHGLYDGGAQVSYAYDDSECMAMWDMNTGHEVVLHACHGNYSTPPVPTSLMFYRNTDTNYYLSYISGNFSSQITNSNPLVVPDSTCFAGYDADREYCVSSPQGDWIQNFCVNSYGEIKSGMSSSYNNLYATYLDPQYALKLDSSDADGGSHGTEFLWYCHDNGNTRCENSGHNNMAYRFVFNSNATSPQHQYDIDFTTPLYSNSSYHIDVPTRNGYTFAGYFDQSGTTRYIDENGSITSAGAAALSNMNWNGSSCNVWYARWCNGNNQTINADGTCSCPYGSTPDTLSEPFYDIGWGESIGNYGMELDEETTFEEGEGAKLLDLVTAINGGEFGAIYDNENALLGAGICTKEEYSSPADYNDLSPLIDTGDPEANQYCWCSLTGGVINGMQYSLPGSKWIYLTGEYGAECYKSCASACAGHIGELLEQNLEYCVPETHNVEYYCQEGDYAHHLEDPNNPDLDPIDTDIVVSGATGYSFGYNVNMSQCNMLGRYVADFKCYRVDNDISVNSASPWNIDSDVYCGAEWEPTRYTVRYNYGAHANNGATGTAYTHTNGATYGVNYTVPAAANNAITPATGYVFVGWNTSSGQTTANFPDAATTPWTRTSGLTVYAAYACDTANNYVLVGGQCVQTYPVTYNCNNNNAGGSAPTDSNSPYQADTTVNVLSGAGNCTSPTGHHFGNWNCGVTGFTLGDTSFTMPASAVSCSATWPANDIYLTWLANNGVMAESNPPMCTYGTLAGDSGSIMPINNPTRSGYTFNGWSISHGLPSGYTQLEYITATGSQYIDTGIKLANTDIIEITFKNSTTSSSMALYGVYNTTAGQSSAFYANSTYYGYNGTNAVVNTNVNVDTGWHTVVHDFVNGRLSLDNASIQFTPFTFTNTENNHLFQAQNDGSYGNNFDGSVKSYKIFRGGSIILNFIPARRNTDNAVGMFDTVTGLFFTSGNGAVFTGVQ